MCKISPMLSTDSTIVRTSIVQRSFSESVFDSPEILRRGKALRDGGATIEDEEILETHPSLVHT